MIAASPDEVWTVLADFSRYAEWNPLSLQVRGQARLGVRAPMVFRNLAAGGDAAALVPEFGRAGPQDAWR